MKAVLFLTYVGVVLAANVVTTYWGLLPAAPLLGLVVPAGTYFAGLALGLRDAIHEMAGVRWVWAGIAAGVVVSLLASDGRIALASGVAFALAEALDMLVYSKLRAKGWRRALVASNIGGAALDTALFLWLSGFGLTAEAWTGQMLVKAVWVTLAALGVAELIRRAVKLAAAR